MDWATYYPAYAKPKVNNSNAPMTSQMEENGIEAVQAQYGSSINGGSDLVTKLTQTKDMPQLTQDVEVADIGCGFGGLLVALAPKLPNTLLLGELS
jgi:tRNA G46 methylase TrmB